MKKTSYLCLLAAVCFALQPLDVSAGRINPKKKYRVKWEEQNSHILIASVCADYGRNTLDFRRCRSYALDLFKSRCSKHTRKYKNAGGAKKRKERQLKQKYCAAARKLP